MYKTILVACCLLVTLAVALGVIAGGARGQSAERPDRMAWFTEARFGMFIHWGPVSLRGTEIGWSRGREVGTEEYDRLFERFDPVRFDAGEWVRVARAAGMKYLVITAKHHDGFCLWDSEYTDYDIMATPFERDVLAELSAECQRQGVRFCVYYSILDWRHPDYPTDSPGGRGRKASSDMERYVGYVRSQLLEILGKYGPVGILWFDGQWEGPWTWDMGAGLYEFLRATQPDLVINNRVGKRQESAAGTSTQHAGNPGDFDTPEQRIGGFNRDRPWETCMTLCRQWAWKPNDEMKSLAECLQTLIRTAGGDGNLLFNVGPMPDGRIEPRQVERLAEMGRWLEKFGPAIYATRGGPFRPGRWGASTCRDDRVYLFVMEWPESGPLLLPAIDTEVLSASLLAGGDVTCEATAGGLAIDLEVSERDAVATVVELTVTGEAFDIAPVLVPRERSGSLACGRPAVASNVFRKMAEYGPDRALDDDPETRWATDAGTSRAWLEVDLGEPRTVGRVLIREGEWDRVRGFRVLAELDGEWAEVGRGERTGAELELRFPAVRTRKVRLEILEATEGPTIWEFQVFGE